MRAELREEDVTGTPPVTITEQRDSMQGKECAERESLNRQLETFLPLLSPRGEFL